MEFRRSRFKSRCPTAAPVLSWIAPSTRTRGPQSVARRSGENRQQHKALYGRPCLRRLECVLVGGGPLLVRPGMRGLSHPWSTWSCRPGRRAYLRNSRMARSMTAFHGTLGRNECVQPPPGLLTLAYSARRTRGFGDFYQHVLVPQGAGKTGAQRSCGSREIHEPTMINSERR